ncbi:hypothetical protein BHM03_00014147 [Ensete ventricosum]|nr:hypothetical protein BHM03_00014147 [Ensete ventricosum]
MVDSTLKKDHIATRASTVPELPETSDDEMITTDTESPKGRLKSLDLWVKISTERDSKWEEAEDIRPAREIVRGEKGGDEQQQVSTRLASETMRNKQHNIEVMSRVKEGYKRTLIHEQIVVNPKNKSSRPSIREFLASPEGFQSRPSTSEFSASPEGFQSRLSTSELSDSPEGF